MIRIAGRAGKWTHILAYMKACWLAGKTTMYITPPFCVLPGKTLWYEEVSNE